MSLAEYLGRDFYIIWRPDRTCGANFSDLFNKSITNLSENEALTLKNGSFYARLDSVEGQKGLDPKFFTNFIKNHNLLNLDYDLLCKDQNQVIVVLDNQPCNLSIPYYLKNLSILWGHKKEIYFKQERDFLLGFHLRLTDFRSAAGVSESSYKYNIEKVLKQISKSGVNWVEKKIYVATDEAIGVDIVEKVINQKVITNDNPSYVTKNNSYNEEWRYNTNRPGNSLVSAMQDLENLSTANIRVGIAQSTFFSLARELAAAKYKSHNDSIDYTNIKSFNELADQGIKKRNKGPDYYFKIELNEGPKNKIYQILMLIKKIRHKFRS